MSNDIKIEEHPAATGAVLQKGVGTWYLTFTGPADFIRTQPITYNEVGDAIDAFSEDKAISYIQRRIAISGYVAQRRKPPRSPSDAAEWSLTYVGRPGR